MEVKHSTNELHPQRIISIYTCNQCQRQFKTKKSLTSHVNHHNSEYHLKSKSGALSSQHKATKVAAENRNKLMCERIDDYKLNPTLCKHCNTELIFNKRENKFCSRSCSASFNGKNRVVSQETKTKIRMARVKYSETQRIPWNNFYPIITYCKHCNRPKFGNKKTCLSTMCIKEYTRKQVKKAFREGRHKGNLYRIKSKPSYMEKSFDAWLKDIHFGDDYFREFGVNQYSNGKYIRTFYLDFYFPNLNLAIELDGSQHLKQKEYDSIRDKYISETLGVKILRISYKEYMAKTRIKEIHSLLIPQ